MAKFPFEEVPVSKQGGKYEGCPPSAVSNPTLAAPHTAALDTGVQSGKDPQLLLFLSTTLGHRQTSRPGCFSVCYAFVSKPLPRYSPAGSRRKTNDQQLQDINEVVEEAELAQTMIHSLTQSSASPIVTCTRSVTGSSSSTSNPLLRAKSIHLQDRFGHSLLWK